jgi:hypothetical protein
VWASKKVRNLKLESRKDPTFSFCFLLSDFCLVSGSALAQTTEERRFPLGVGTLRPPGPSEEVNGEGGLSQLFQAVRATAFDVFLDSDVLFGRQSAEKE